MNRVNEKICRSSKNQGHRDHRKVKCELSQALVMINMYVKFNVHSSNAKQIIVLKVADRRTDGRTRRMTKIGIRQNLAAAYKDNNLVWLNLITFVLGPTCHTIALCASMSL